MSIIILKVWEAVARETNSYELEPNTLLVEIQKHMEIEDEQLKDSLNLIMQYKLIVPYGKKYTFSNDLKKYPDVLDDIETG